MNSETCKADQRAIAANRTCEAGTFGCCILHDTKSPYFTPAPASEVVERLPWQEHERRLLEVMMESVEHDTYKMDAWLKLYIAARDSHAEAELARVRGLLQRLTDELSSYWSGCSKCASWLNVDYPGHFDGCERCDKLRQAYRMAVAGSQPNFPQSSSLVSQGAESADIGKLDTADKSGVEMGKVNRVELAEQNAAIAKEYGIDMNNLPELPEGSAETGGEKAGCTFGCNHGGRHSYEHVLGCDEYHGHTIPDCCDQTCWCRNGCPHPHLDGIDQAIGPDKVWKCQACKGLFREVKDGIYTKWLAVGAESVRPEKLNNADKSAERFEKALRDIIDERFTELDMMWCDYQPNTMPFDAWHDGVSAAWEQFDLVKQIAKVALAESSLSSPLRPEIPAVRKLIAALNQYECFPTIANLALVKAAWAWIETEPLNICPIHNKKYPCCAPAASPELLPTQLEKGKG